MPCHMTIYIVHSVDVPIQLEHSTSPVVDALHSHLQAEEEEERASGFEQLLPSLLLLDVVFQLLVYYALADPSLSSSQFPCNLLALCGCRLQAFVLLPHGDHERVAKHLY